MFLTPATPQVGAGGGNVKVYARTRPLLAQELQNGAENILIVNSPDKQVLVKSPSEKVFKFENVFSEYCSQEEVYKNTVAPLVAKVGDGSNATVFAYGQTGSGKTFTIGTDPCTAKEDEGILQRALHTLLGCDRDEDGKQSPRNSKPKEVTVSFMEVYNETIFDLLAPARKPLKAKLVAGCGLSPVGMVEEKVRNVEEGLRLLEKGSRLRSVGSTAMNQRSSRSHALIYLKVDYEEHQGCLKLVDLAGAEGVGRSQSTGQQFSEGVAINKGLLTLGKVLAALSSSTTGYVPYRESILTRLLKDSLGGTSDTAMIACVNPASFNVCETVNTLTYAEQARNIRSRPQVLSTVKRLGIKRHYEDVTATPGAWARRMNASGKKPDHNSTVSTPGHKVPKRRCVAPLNNTFATPSNSTRDIFSSSLLGSRLAPPPPPPIFVDDSPTNVLGVKSPEAIDKSSSVSFSPMLERMTNRLEQSVMTQLESIEDRVADRIIERLTKKRGKKRISRERKKSVKHQSSTPTDMEKSVCASDNSDNDVLGTSIINAIFKKDTVKTMLQGIVTDALNTTQINLPMRSKRFSCTPQTIKEKSLPSTEQRRPLADVTNCKMSGTVCKQEDDGRSVYQKSEVQNSSDMDVDYDLLRNIPITSTAFVDSRAVRKSTRLSTRHSIHRSLFSKMEADASTVANHDGTIIFNGTRSPTTADRTINSGREKKENAPYSEVCSATFVMEDSQSKGETSTLDITLSSPLQIDQIFRKGTNTGVRRSSRFAAMKATHRNFEILQGQSPLRKICRNRRSSIASKKTKGNVTVCIAPTNESTLMNETDGKWQLVVSPRLQKQHNDKILDILNTGSLKTLQQLPTVGPKTAMVISNFREFYGGFKCVEDLKDVPALPKNYYSRFMKANLMDQICF